MKTALLTALSALTLLTACGTITQRPGSNPPVYDVDTNSPVVKTIQTVQAVNEAVPSPFQGAVNLGLATALALVGAIAKIRSNRAKVEADAMKEAIEHSTDAPILKAMVAKATSTVKTK